VAEGGGIASNSWGIGGERQQSKEEDDVDIPFNIQ
jgi:hypothetical protein